MCVRVCVCVEREREIRERDRHRYLYIYNIYILAPVDGRVGQEGAEQEEEGDDSTIHHILLVIAILCEGQLAPWPIHDILSLVFLCSRIYHPVMTTNHSHPHTTAIRLRDVCAKYDLPPTLPLYATHHTILLIAILCKGQHAPVDGRLGQEGAE